ncbi:laforin-like, partial [Camelus ferus]|uniref:Laforin-like n=1 Tax=Camelus ferus TaxID=419612 RepID=A0A8B8TGK5_CAMFR
LGLLGSRPRPAPPLPPLLHVLPPFGLCLRRSGEEAPPRPRGPRGPRAAAELVLSWLSPRRRSGRRGAGPVPQPRGRLGWCSRSGGRWAVRGTPSRRRLAWPGGGTAGPRAAVPAPTGSGWGLGPSGAAHVLAGRAGGRGSPAPGAERAMCHGPRRRRLGAGRVCGLAPPRPRCRGARLCCCCLLGAPTAALG